MRTDGLSATFALLLHLSVWLPTMGAVLADNLERSGEQNEEQGAAVFGLRLVEDGELHDGVLVIKAPSELLLFGRHLSSSVSVALTASEGQPGDDCTHTDRVKSLPLQPMANSTHVAQVTVDLPWPGTHQSPYYLCLRDQRTGWRHQGSDSWLGIQLKQDLLPLYMKIIVIACLLMLSGLFSGLNLGLMALDKNELRVIISCGSETEKRYARAIEPVRRRGNYLLCSILFSNVLVNSTIAVLLEELTSGIVAVMTSTIFIVMFGEILPQAFCSRHGLAVGAKTVAITYFCMFVTFPLSYPVSWCLDWALGEEIGHAYDRERLMEFIRVTRDYNNLEADEVNIISGALKLKQCQLSEVMTRIDDVYMLDVASVLDFHTIQAIIELGYSRIPVHESGNKGHIIALLFVKDLALLDPDACTPLQTMINFYDHPIMFLFEDTTLDKALNEFKTGVSHMAFVRRVIDDGHLDPVYEITGIVTLEDVIEEIMQIEINDETDTLTDNRRRRRRQDTQVRRDFSPFTKLGHGATGQNLVTPQLCLAAYQYLATSVEPFTFRYVSDSILKRLLTQKIYHKVQIEDSKSEKLLYRAGEPADFFLMILEGRARVTCGKEGLIFEAGPFSFFGKSALQLRSGLEKPVDWQINPISDRKESSNTKPNAERRESLVTKTLNGQLSISMKKLEQMSTDNESQTSADSSVSASQTSRLLKSESRVSIHSMVAHHFVPDYTVEIVATTVYLKVTRHEYLTAVRTTLVERGASNNED